MQYKKKAAVLLLILLLVFGAFSFISIRNISAGSSSSFFGLGIPGENWIVLFFSFCGTVKVVLDLYRMK
jgi:hypothetical protein